MLWLRLWSLAPRRLPLLRSPLLWPKGRLRFHMSTSIHSQGSGHFEHAAAIARVLIDTSESVAMGGGHAGQAETGEERAICHLLMRQKVCRTPR
ncbi:hypothetical protein V8C86DRAFT_2529725 [Haematococcus lacustris]